LELALGQPGDAEELQQSLHSALEETERLVRLTDDLLVLARVDSEHLPLRAQPVELRATAERVVERLGEAGANIEVAGSKVVVQADPLWIEQIVTNLLVNASRFAQSRVRLEVTAPRHGRAEVVVADDGPGFLPDALPTVFDRFSRASRARQREGGGAGLGLAIVAALVRAHGGSLEATNGPPLGGARVAFSLPVDTLARTVTT
jgi:two-component system OmpR family sensor kinase